MSLKYFGTDGIRGVALEKLNSELAFKIGLSIVSHFKVDSVVIGMDTRESSPLLAYSIANGINQMGSNVLFAGVVPTPAIALYAKDKNLIGVMITASHNPYTDNGIKIFKYGYKTTYEDELALEELIDSKFNDFLSFGSFKYVDDVKSYYLNKLRSFNFNTSNLSVGYDNANGANYEVSYEILSTQSPNSYQISNSPNGKNINLNCGSTYINSLINLVQTKKLDIGFSFDGDGDRIIVVDKSLKVYDGDLIIYLISKFLKQQDKLSKNTVVLTKMSNPGILEALSNLDINYVLTDIGDKYVFHELYTNNYIIGGESSGHIILTHLLHTGDGLLVATYILHILSMLNKSLEELTSDVNLYPILTTNIKNVNKDVLKKEIVINRISEISKLLSENSILLVRPSGTESLIRVTISSKDLNDVNNYTKEIVELITKEGMNL